MNQQEIRTYVESYFKAFQSPIIEEAPSHFSVQLPVEVDKDLGNRPFYWTYVEKIGMEPNLLTLTFIFDRDHLPEGTRGEELPFGSRRLHQIFESAKKHGKYIRLYEAADDTSHSLGSVPLVPWLGVNYKVEFICDQKKDLLISLGIHLISGEITSEFYQKACTLPLTPKLPDYSFTMHPIFGIDSAASRLEQHIQDLLDQEDRIWAEEAMGRLEEEKALVESYYTEEAVRQTSSDKETDEYAIENNKNKLQQEKETRLNELTWQFQPKIQVNMINAGLFYLRTPMA